VDFNAKNFLQLASPMLHGGRVAGGTAIGAAVASLGPRDDRLSRGGNSWLCSIIDGSGGNGVPLYADRSGCVGCFVSSLAGCGPS
jgi:hypothetical protein